jgi:NADPH-dependent glutamate synthase beta subunit-like oxidoreductase
MRLGEKYSLEDLLKDGYKSVLLAFGAHQGSRMGIEGEPLKGVFDGVSFLKKINLKKRVKAGKRVLVIGGGNVALDAARSSLRLGATQVTIVYRRSRDDMPASTDEIHEAEQEGINILDMTDPIKINGQDGRITGLLCQRTRPGEYDSSGRRRPQPISGSEFLIEADMLIAAIGQKPETGFLEKEGFTLHRNGTIQVDASSLSTNRPGVFAAGDMVTGPATVLEAMASGEQAAISIHRYLNGLDLKSERFLQKKEPVDVSWREQDLELEGRQPMPELVPTTRTSCFSETNLGFTRQTAVKEARRCLRCDLEDKAGEQ